MGIISHSAILLLLDAASEKLQVFVPTKENSLYNNKKKYKHGGQEISQTAKYPYPHTFKWLSN